MPSYVNNIGWVDHADLDDWFSFADAVIVPSRWEGLPLVIPEALRNGTPVFCAETSGMEALITRGETGDHFPLSVEAIAATLAGLAANQLAAMRPACRRLYEARYALDHWEAEMTALLTSLAKPGTSEGVAA